MRKLGIIVISLLIATAATFGLLGFGVYRAAQHEPEFYREALTVTIETHETAGEELEKSVLGLHNDARREGRWEAVFTDAQVNGWVVADLPEKFPNLLPPNLEEPRVVIEPDVVRLAFRYRHEGLSTVVSMAAEIQLTDEVNTLAVRIRDVRAGSLPVPFKQFLDRITEQATNSDVQLRWAQTNGDPLALITLPELWEPSSRHRVLLDALEVRSGEVYVAGSTRDSAQAFDSSGKAANVARQP